jgi:phage terminase small subunit
MTEQAKPRRLTFRQRKWLEVFLKTWNATESARQAGYKDPNSNGPKQLTFPYMREAIEARLTEVAMSATEVFSRLSDIARGDVGDLMDIESMSFDINLNKAKDAGKTKLIKKVKQITKTIKSQDGEDTETNIQEIELYSALDALQVLAKYHGLLVDRTEISGDVIVKTISGVKMDEI